MSALPEDDDPWAPLPPEQLFQRPGEEHMVHKRPDRVPSRGPQRGPTGGEAPAKPPQPPSAPPPAAVDPAQEAALAALRARLAAAPPAQSMLADVLRRQQHQERKRRAGAATDPALTALHVHGRDPAAQPQLEYAPGAEGRDLREESEWFAALPPVERERLQAAWAKKRVVAAETAAGQRRWRNRRFAAGVAAALATLLAGTGAAWHATLGAGLCVGIWWRRRPADRFLDPLRALACFVVAHGAAMWQADLPNPTLFMDAIVFVACATLIGFDGEIRRTGGFDQR